MSDADWDAEDFEPITVEKPTVLTDKWEGEDEDDAVKDNWDDEDDSKPADAATGVKDPTKATQVKKKKPLKDRIAEKEAKMQEDARKKAGGTFLDAYTSNSTNAEEAKVQTEVNTPEEIAEAKENARKAQEESDLQLAKEAFGADRDQDGTEIEGLDSANPTTKEDFDKFGELLKDKLLQFEKSSHYVGFLDNLIREVCISLEPDDLKTLGGTLSALSNEKIKQQKAVKGKKKKKGVSLTVGRGDGYEEYTAASYDGFDDFI